MIFVLIGGKNKDSKLNIIEAKAFSLSNKEKPFVLYIPFAAKDIDKSYNKFKDLVKGLNCEIECLNFKNINNVRSLFDKADIIYVGGGVSDALVNFFKVNKLDNLLREYLATDKVYVGSSAGAMLVSIIAMGDKDMYSDNYHNYNYKMVNCLGILPISICPHYQNEDLVIYNDAIKSLDMPSFGIEEDTALVVDNNTFYVIKDDKKRSIYYYNKNNKMMPLYENQIYSFKD